MSISWKIEKQGETTKVQLNGSVDEEADFKGLVAQIDKSGRIRLDVGGVGRINSCGVREWINFMRALPDKVPLEIENFTPVLVSQLNMINNFVGSARVMSVHAPYVCPSCGREEAVIVDVSSQRTVALGAVPCKECGESMEFDDLEESYFAFLHDTAIAR